MDGKLHDRNPRTSIQQKSRISENPGIWEASIRYFQFGCPIEAEGSLDLPNCMVRRKCHFGCLPSCSSFTQRFGSTRLKGT